MHQEFNNRYYASHKECVKLILRDQAFMIHHLQPAPILFIFFVFSISKNWLLLFLKCFNSTTGTLDGLFSTEVVVPHSPFNPANFFVSISTCVGKNKKPKKESVMGFFLAIYEFMCSLYVNLLLDVYTKNCNENNHRRCEFKLIWVALSLVIVIEFKDFSNVLINS